jgi:two-component system NtrC family sensor kinase
VTEDAFDLVFCDLMMHGLSGMELAAQLARRAPERLARVVFMTGGAFVPAAARFMAEHADACLEKPFDVVAETRRRLAARRD